MAVCIEASGTVHQNLRISFMSFRRLTLLLYLPMAMLICGQAGYIGGNFSTDEHLVFSEEEASSFNDRDEGESPDTGLTGVIVDEYPKRQGGQVALGDSHVLRGGTLELHATGPPVA
jgi:hypothetical protein